MAIPCHTHNAYVAYGLRQNPNPCFFVTLPIFDVAMETELKIVVLDMRERVSKTATRIGQASFHVKSLIMAPGEQLKLPLHSGVQLPIPRRNSLHHSTGHRGELINEQGPFLVQYIGVASQSQIVFTTVCFFAVVT
jgi:hypothetical protein